MKNRRIWVNLSIAGLTMVSLLGLLLRTKIIFTLPFINYNHLVEAHGHFTFSGWVTLSLQILLVNELLTEQQSRKVIYEWLIGAVAAISWCMMIVYLLKGYDASSIAVSSVFIFITFFFAYVFIKDVIRAGVSKPVRLLSISAVSCLVLSSFGPFAIDYIYFSHSFQSLTFLYRDSLFTYLHFQYNGFFSLAILSLLFNEVEKKFPQNNSNEINLFTYVLVVSLIPALFLSFLWQDPKTIYRIIAIAGSALTFICCLLFIKIYPLLRTTYFRKERFQIRALFVISLFSFVLKLFLQCFTIFPPIGNAIFGNRPIIMSFLHLVFLCFVTLFILAWYARNQMLDANKRITRLALGLFAAGVVINEVLLMGEGLIIMFSPASVLFLWLLWAAAIWLLISAALILVARAQTKELN